MAKKTYLVTLWPTDDGNGALTAENITADYYNIYDNGVLTFGNYEHADDGFLVKVKSYAPGAWRSVE
jgi:hypothetical protein